MGDECYLKFVYEYRRHDFQPPDVAASSAPLADEDDVGEDDVGEDDAASANADLAAIALVKVLRAMTLLVSDAPDPTDVLVAAILRHLDAPDDPAGMALVAALEGYKAATGQAP